MDFTDISRGGPRIHSSPVFGVVLIPIHKRGNMTKKRPARIVATMLLLALLLTGCAFTDVLEGCPFEEGQVLNLKDEIEQAEGWNGPPSISPTRTHFLFREEGVLKAKGIGYSPRPVSSLKAERNLLTYQLCGDGWLRVEIRYSNEGLFSSDSAWFLAENFKQGEGK